MRRVDLTLIILMERQELGKGGREVEAVLD